MDMLAKAVAEALAKKGIDCKITIKHLLDCVV